MTELAGQSVAGEKKLEAKDTQGLEISLVSEQQSIAAGSIFTLGIKIKHDKGFHTYWKYPGLVGLPTAVKWKLPKGFEAGEIQWAYPELSSMAGNPCFGYERDVLLLVQMKAPEKLQESEVKLVAEMSWMCCSDNCFPGFKDFSVRLPVSKKSEIDQSVAADFRAARSMFPLKKSPWSTQVLSKPDELWIKLRFKEKISKQEGEKVRLEPEYFFSGDGQISSEIKQKFIKQVDGGFILTVKRSEYSPKGMKAIHGVLKVGDVHYSIDVKY